MIIYEDFSSNPNMVKKYAVERDVQEVTDALFYVVNNSGLDDEEKAKANNLLALVPSIESLEIGLTFIRAKLTNGEFVNVWSPANLSISLMKKLETFTYSKGSRNKETQGAGKKCNLDITRCLTIATSHITEETDAKLCEPNWCGTMGLSVYDKEDYGYWIWCDIDTETIARLPEDLRACIKLAKENNCDWLCLDCDGCEVDGLPTYVW